MSNDFKLVILKVEYGMNDNYIDITDKVKELFFKDNKLFIPKEIKLNDVFTDPYYGISKEIKIFALINNFPVNFCEKELNNNLLNDVLINETYTHFLNKFNIITYKNDNSSSLNYDNSYITNFNGEIKDIDDKYDIISNTYIDICDSFILIIDFPLIGGGTSNFLNTIIKKYKYKQTFVILRNTNNFINIFVNNEYIFDKKYTNEECIQFLKQNIKKIEKIFVNHTLHHSDYFMNEIFNIDKEKTYITHDYSLLFNNSQPMYDDIMKKSYIKQNIYINKFDKIITQNIKNIHLFENFLDNKQHIVITELPDYRKSLDLIQTNNNNTIIIGIIGYITKIKGIDIINDLNKYIKSNYLNIKIIVFGLCDLNIESYKYVNIKELNNLLIQHKPNILLECSIWPETYSYTLTLSMLTQLPIIVLNKKFDSVIKDRLLTYKKKYYFNTIEECLQLAKEVKQDFFYTIEPTIYYNSFWDEYFITRKKKEIYTKNNFKYDIKSYLIYFPQFHKIEENDKRFYEGFTDMVNLDYLKNNINNQELETVSLEEIDIKQLKYYDLTNSSIVQKQINIVKDYNISGFAIYYYWFSTNTITNKNMIMENVIDMFFNNDKINLQKLKVFFIWANENWTNNVAFGNSESYIENNYNIENIKKNINNLMKYFKHDNYLKIENKPVFFIYHPFLMTDDEINLFYNELNKECIANNFAGVHFVLNSINKDYNNYTNFYINFNYKKFNRYFDNLQSKHIIDYKEYMLNKHNNKNQIQTIIFDFDNTPRLCKPNKLIFSTKCINNSEINKIIYSNNIIKKYDDNSKQEIDKILLINAFNEWGEKMVFEPSNEYGYYNLNLLKSQIEEKKDYFILNEYLINKYDTLFHKYKYNFSHVNDNIYIKTTNNFQITGEYITHIHCHNLNIFDQFFDKIIDNCIENTSVIVTYSVINNNIIEKYNSNVLFLEVMNKGYDIGGKICCIKYLYDIKYNYKLIFFLHSKSCETKRNEYMLPLVKDKKRMQYIIKLLTNTNNNILGVFPNLLYNDNIVCDTKYVIGTKSYKNDILNFLQCTNFDKQFVEGNMMVLNKEVIDFCFYEKENIFYNLLNSYDSIDLNWMNFNYYINNGINVTNETVLKNYNLDKDKYLTNDFQALDKNCSLRDCMIEHVFERIWLNIIFHLNGNYKLVE
jgi:hypothetical protein